MNCFSKSIFALFLQFNLITIVYAQNSDSLKFISYEDKIMLKANLDTQTEEFIFSEGSDIYKLALNNKTKMSISLDYKIISGSISFTPKFLPGNNDDHSKGKSSFTDFKFRFFPGRFIQTLHYQRMKGFYLKNTAELLPDWESEQTYLQFPDLKSTTFGGSTSFVFNPEFSLKSLLYQREWQKFSAGSFVPSVNYDLNFLSNDFGTTSGKERELDLSLYLAYYYNWVLAEKFTLAPHAYTGSGIRFTKYRGQDDGITSVEKDEIFTYSYGAGLHLGFNSDKFLWGGRLDFTSFNYKQNDETFAENSIYGLIFVGYRFNSPKKISKTYEKLEQKIPF